MKNIMARACNPLLHLKARSGISRANRANLWMDEQLRRSNLKTLLIGATGFLRSQIGKILLGLLLFLINSCCTFSGNEARLTQSIESLRPIRFLTISNLMGASGYEFCLKSENGEEFNIYTISENDAPQFKVSINKPEKEAVEIIHGSDFEKIICLFLDNVFHKSPLHSSRKQNIKTLKEWIETRRFPSSSLPLIRQEIDDKFSMALLTEDIKEITALINRGADPNMPFHGFTPLIIGCVTGNKEMIRVLIENGADPSMKHHGDVTAISWAQKNCSKEIQVFLSELSKLKSTKEQP